MAYKASAAQKARAKAAKKRAEKSRGMAFSSPSMSVSDRNKQKLAAARAKVAEGAIAQGKAKDAGVADYARKQRTIATQSPAARRADEAKARGETSYRGTTKTTPSSGGYTSPVKTDTGFGYDPTGNAYSRGNTPGMSFVKDYKPTLNNDLIGPGYGGAYGEDGGFLPYDTAGSRGVIEESYYKQYKEQFGDTMSDEVIRAMASAKAGELYAEQDAYSRQEALAAQQQAARDEEIARQEREYENERLSMMTERERRLEEFQKGQDARYAREGELARETTGKEMATTERLLGAEGRLTTMPGSDQLVDIDRRLQDTLGALQAQKQAEYQMYEAQLRGADEATLDAMGARLSEVRAAAAQAKQDSIMNLAVAKENAINSGNAAQQKWVDDMLAQVVADDAAMDIEASELAGYAIDVDGNAMQNSSGNLIEMPQGKQNYKEGTSWESGGHKYMNIYNSTDGTSKTVDLGPADGRGGGGSGSGSGGAGVDSAFIKKLANDVLSGDIGMHDVDKYGDKAVLAVGDLVASAKKTITGWDPIDDLIRPFLPGSSDIYSPRIGQDDDDGDSGIAR